MVLGDKHIAYLTLVRRGIIRLWWAPKRRASRYICVDRAEVPEVDQTVAAQMKALGATHLIWKGGHQYVALTARGEHILVEEDEAWA